MIPCWVKYAIERLSNRISRSQVIRRATSIPQATLWNKDASVLLKQFLLTTTGQVFMAELIARRPSFISRPAGRCEGVAMQSKMVEGYELAVQRILDLAEPPNDLIEGAPPLYPDLDADDKVWGKTSRSPR
jgi:hypothetical protein